MSRIRRIAFLAALAAIALLVIGGPAYAGTPVTYYVNDDAAGANNGTSWKNAFTDLQSALDAALAGDSIWVAAGAYKPSLSIDGSDDARTASFSLKSGVALYGGFAGVEKDLKKRSSDPALTVLSGDIGVAGDATDNCYHVVYACGVTGAVLDCFTVTGGRGDRTMGDYSLRVRDTRGAGMYNFESALAVVDCVFSDNRVDGKTYGSIAAGGGMYNEMSAPTVINCVFRLNHAGGAWATNAWGRGGGMYNSGTYGTYPDESWPHITGTTFSENTAYAGADFEYGGGGGMYNAQGVQAVERCTFTDNSATHGGAMFNSYGQPTLTNCLFTDNFNTFGEGRGGAVFNMAGATILNCTFSKNGWRLLTSGPEPRYRPYTAAGGAVYNYRAAGTITNCIFSDNAVRARGGAIAYDVPRYGTLSNCLFYENIRWQVGYDEREIQHVAGLPILAFTESDNVYDVEPLLANPAAGDFHLRYDSPCIDAGFNGKQGNYTWPWGLPVTDFEGDKRVADGDGDGAPNVDIGADEYIPNLPGLRAFLTALSDDGELDTTLAARLLADVDTASAALAQDQEAAALASLDELIADAKATLGDTETAALVEMKTKAVIAEI